MTTPEELVRAIFDPLTQALGLQEPVEMRAGHTEYSVGYPGSTVGVEVLIGLRQRSVVVMLFSAQGSAIPRDPSIVTSDGYYDEIGRRYKLYLGQAIRELSLRGAVDSMAAAELESSGGDLQHVAVRWSSLLQENWDCIVANRELLFGTRV